MRCLATSEQTKIEFTAHRLLPLCSHALHIGLGASSVGPTAPALLWGPEEGKHQGGGGGGKELGGMGQTPGNFTVPRTCTSVAVVCSERSREISGSQWCKCQSEQRAGVTAARCHRREPKMRATWAL